MARRQPSTFVRYLHGLAPAQQDGHVSDRDLLCRFALEHDEPALPALVRRPGVMVLAVGRRVLHNVDDAEDVLQATFLVLARKAGSLRWRASVGSWLYLVAYRLALKAHARAARRSALEAQAVGKSCP